MTRQNKDIKVLIIEDDKSLREMYESKLDKEGFAVSTAIDGEDGISKIKSGQPDLIMLDLMMPKKNGFDVLEEVNKDDTLNKTPIIVLSNLGLDDDINLAKSLGAREYLIKSSIMLNDLVKKIHQYAI